MPPPPVHAGGGEQPILQKLGMGAMMGGSVGLTLGFLFGSFAIITRGAGPRGPWNTLAQYMLTSGGTFAFFMSIGSVIRTEEEPGMSRGESLAVRRAWMMRTTWDEERRRRERAAKTQ